MALSDRTVPAPSAPRRWRGLLVLLGVLGLLGYGWWRSGVGVAILQQSVQPKVSPLPQDPLIQVYFNQSQAATYKEPYRGIERLGDDLEAIVVEAIAQAQRSIDVAVQELRLPKVAHALAERHRAGVTVRVIIEDSYNRIPGQQQGRMAAEDEREQTRSEEFLALADRDRNQQLSPQELAQHDALTILRNAGVPLIDDRADGSQGSDLMHHKFLVIDRRFVVTGSVNLSTSEVHGDFGSPESRGNANHLLKIDSAALATVFLTEFAQMWGDGPGKRPDSRFGLKKPYRPPQMVRLGNGSAVMVQFSPTSTGLPWQNSVNGLISRVLNTATQRVDKALFVFSEQAIGDVLQQRQRQGVKIRTLIEPSFAYRSYSEGLDMLGVQLPDQRCRFEPGNAPWRRSLSTVGIPQLPEGDLLHHKFAIVDGKTVITGSQNWSAAANHQNDETLLVIFNPTVAAHFEREFERLYETAELGVPAWLQQKIQQEKERCRLNR